MIRLGTQPDLVGHEMTEAIMNATQVLLSPLARAEIGIKLSVGKLLLPVSESDYWEGLSARLQATELPFDSTHAALLSSMPLIHRDPFDRMIAAQCLAENVYLATVDPVFQQYGVKVIV